MRWLLGALAIAVSSCAPTSAPIGQTAHLPGDGEAEAAFQAQQIDVHFVAALSRYMRGDKAGAGKYLEEAGEVMRRQGGSSRNVRSFAKRVQGSGTLAETEFEQLFASSHRQMAEVHRGRADTLLADRREQQAGESMEAMAYHVERSAEWSGEPLSPQQQSEVSNLRSAGSALRTGSGYLVKGSGYALQGTGWALGKGFQFLTNRGDNTTGTTGKVMRGTGLGGETGSRWIEGFGSGIKRAGDWILGR